MDEQKRNNKRSKMTFFALVSILVLGLILRLIRFPVNPIQSNDEMYFVQMMLKPLAGIASADAFTFLQEFARYLNYTWVPGALWPGTLSTGFLHTLGFPLTEALYIFPYTLFSLLGVVLIYLVAQELFRDTRISVAAAFLVAISPFFISLSRMLQHHLIGSVMFLSTIYFALRYFRSKKKTDLLLLSAAVGLQFMMDIQFYLVLPVLFVGAVLFLPKKGDLLQRVKHVFYSMLTFRVILVFLIVISPLLPSFFYYAAQGHIDGTYIYHPFVKEKYYGMYFFSVVSFIYQHHGLGLFLLFCFGLATVLFKTLKGDRTALFLLLWIGVVAAPWVFAVAPGTTTSDTFSTNIVHVLILMSTWMFFAFFDQVKHMKFALRSSAKLFLAVFVVLSIVTTAIALDESVYLTGHLETQYFEGKETFGTYKENNGLKTAGHYLRTVAAAQNGLENIVVFSDNYHYVASYYFGTTVLADLDPESDSLDSKWNTLTAHQEPTHIVIHAYRYELIPSEIRSAYPVEAIVTYGNEEVVYVMGKDYKGSSVMYPVETYDPLFDAQFGNIDSVYISYG